MSSFELSPHFVRATKFNYEFYPAMTAGHFAGYANYTNYADERKNNQLNPLLRKMPLALPDKNPRFIKIQE